MKLKSKIVVFTVLTLIEIVKGAWWAAAAQPVILSLGAVLGVLNLDIVDFEPIKWNLYIHTFNEPT